ncbi:lysozyme inhibitor LprI family protein [Bradyrhizobium sp. SYSU BS000235]|uniref:lysozyme inhibitor LprI family protein n=1 Tax=Bradyrhizobium sp. SYSU BS000235 TaxID=3411332 RepID=UPI003C790D95
MKKLKAAGWLILSGVVVGLWSVPAAEAADYAPLDCAKASSAAERTICSDYRLGQQEARVATLFEVTTSLVAMGQRGDIQDQQRAFLKERDACKSSVPCLRNVYEARDKQLESALAQIRQRGPF